MVSPLRARPLFLALLLSPFLVATTAQAADAQQAGRDPALDSILARIARSGNGTSSELFYELARGRDDEAFARLREGLVHATDESLAVAAFGACALFKGTPLANRVASWLAKQSFKAEKTSHQVAATRALTYFWMDEETALTRVVRNHPSPRCRAIALEPLIAGLVTRGDRASCKVLFENADVSGPARTAVLGALFRFDSNAARNYLAGRLRERRLDVERKLVLLDLFEHSEERNVLTAIEKCLGDPSDEVRLRAIEVLGPRGDGEFAARLKKIAQQGDENFIIDAIMLLASQREGDPTWALELYGFTQSQSPSVRLGAARALARVPTQDALTLLHGLLRDPDPRVRNAALEPIVARRQPRSIPKLIAALGGAGGLHAEELAQDLRLFTGLDLGRSQKRWEAWFEAEGSEFQMPTREEALAAEQARRKRRNTVGEGRTASFYGLRIESDRVAFVIDTSGSMSAPAGGRFTRSEQRGTTRLNVAKQELTHALRQLLDGVRFNVFSFSTDVSAFEPRMVELGANTRAKAMRETEGWTANGGTAIYDALVRALADDETDTIYLLTDGEPTMGIITEVGEIRRRVMELASLRGVRIHGIAIGQESELLRWLADDTGGRYVEIL